MNITHNLTISGNGIWRANTIAADFLRGQPGYIPDLDPRLPKHSTITANLVPGNSAVISVANISIFPQPDIETGEYGAVRVRQEVILYTNRWTANSTLTGLTRNISGSAGTSITANVITGNLISSLGLRTLSL